MYRCDEWDDGECVLEVLFQITSFICLCPLAVFITAPVGPTKDPSSLFQQVGVSEFPHVNADC